MDKITPSRIYKNNTRIVSCNTKKLYLRFHSGAMFEIGNLKKEILDKELIQKYFYMLNFTYNLSNKLINIISDTQI